jgi:acetyltransferase-like isoleucine patch superfamily enzyme
VRNLLRIPRLAGNRLRSELLGLRLAHLGDGAVVEKGVSFHYAERIRIGAHARVAGNAVLRANTDHPDGVSVGRRTSILESVLINANRGSVVVGDDSWLGPFCLLYGNGDIRIGDGVLVAGHTSINTVSHHAERVDIPISEQGTEVAPVVIHDDVWIGLNAVILQGVTIGRGAIIGAGSVVTRDIPAWSVVRGAPAKVVRSRLGDVADSRVDHATARAQSGSMA